MAPTGERREEAGRGCPYVAGGSGWVYVPDCTFSRMSSSALLAKSRDTCTMSVGSSAMACSTCRHTTDGCSRSASLTLQTTGRKASDTGTELADAPHLDHGSDTRATSDHADALVLVRVILELREGPLDAHAVADLEAVHVAGHVALGVAARREVCELID